MLGTEYEFKNIAELFYKFIQITSKSIELGWKHVLRHKNVLKLP